MVVLVYEYMWLLSHATAYCTSAFCDLVEVDISVMNEENTVIELEI